MKLSYTSAMNPVIQKQVEDLVSSYLFENTALDDDETQMLAEQIVILVAQRLAPQMVMEVVK